MDALQVLQIQRYYKPCFLLDSRNRAVFKLTQQRDYRSIVLMKTFQVCNRTPVTLQTRQSLLRPCPFHKIVILCSHVAGKHNCSYPKQLKIFKLFSLLYCRNVSEGKKMGGEIVGFRGDLPKYWPNPGKSFLKFLSGDLKKIIGMKSSFLYEH